MTDETEPLVRRFVPENDALKILVVMLAIYLVYAAAGVLLGFSVNGVASVLQRVTFLTAVYALLTLALNLHWGYTGLFNIGITGFMAAGVYTTAVFTRPSLSAGEEVPLGFGVPGLDLPLLVGVVAGLVAAALLGLVAALPALRLRADYLAIVTIGLAETVRLTLQSDTFSSFTLFGMRLGTGGGNGISAPDNPVRGLFYSTGEPGSPPTALGDAVFGAAESLGVGAPVVVNWGYTVVLVGFVVAVYWLVTRVGYSPFGRVLKAIREDEDVAGALGKNTALFKVKVFMLGCALMGLAGILWRGSQGQVFPGVFQPEFTFYVWIALIIGGAGSNTGSVIGAAVFAAAFWEGPRYLNDLVNTAFDVGSAPTTFDAAVAPLLSLDPLPFLTYVLEGLNGSLRLVLMGVLLVWLMQNRPEGVMGGRKEPASTLDLFKGGGGDE